MTASRITFMGADIISVRRIAALALALAVLSAPGVAAETSSPVRQLQVDLDGDGKVDRVSVFAFQRFQRAELRVSYADGRSETPLILQYLEGDEIWLDERKGPGDPLCREPSDAPNWPSQTGCSIYGSHSAFPTFAMHHSRYGVVLFGYHDPARHEARPIRTEEQETAKPARTGGLIMFLPFARQP